MKKKFNHYVSLSLLLLSVLPFSLVSAETVEEVPTGETTISSMADDPLNELKEKAANQVPTIESTPESESVEDTPTNESETKEDVPKTEDTTETKPKPQARGGGIGPQAVNLIEGVDIDAQFAQLLRTDKSVTNGGGAWSGYGKGANQLTDDDMAALIEINVRSKNLISVKGVEYATNLITLNCGINQLTEIDVSNNNALETLNCFGNQLTEIDVSNNNALENLGCSSNQLTEIDVSNNSMLEVLNISINQITEVDVKNNTNLKYLYCSNNLLTELDISFNTDLIILECASNQLTDLETSNNPALENLTCNDNQLTNLDVRDNLALTYLNSRDNQLIHLDTNNNVALTYLNCDYNKITDLNITNNLLLEKIECSGNQIRELDVSNNTKLIEIACAINQLTELDVSHNPALLDLACGYNQLTELDVRSNTLLKTLMCPYNKISDITSAMGLTDLDYMDFGNQHIEIEVEEVIAGMLTVDKLKTTASLGLSVANINISGSPILTPNGDKIDLSNVTEGSLMTNMLSFQYDGTQLTEGASVGYKSFSGEIKFLFSSVLNSELIPDKVKVKSGGTISWTWEIKGYSKMTAENIHANFSIPSGLIIKPDSILINGVSGTLADINGTNNLGNLDAEETIIISLDTIATGNVDEWLEPVAKSNWEDINPRNKQTKGLIQIHDDEQTYTPKDSDDMAIQSVPVYFNHGTNPIMSTAQTYHLHAMNYQSNTKVVTDGFYTRIKDDRAISTGWKLTAKLSDFKDSSNQPMPNGTGTMLKLENMSIERVTDRDTPQEVIDPTPSGLDVPSVQATETLVAGQSTAKTIVSAQPNEGQDTWQLRMPFDKVSLSIPANAGKKKTVYKANLTWSLDDTP